MIQIMILCMICVHSKSGLLSHEFYEPGIFFYSDRNFHQAAEYIGTIIVKPKQAEHFISLTPDGFSTGGDTCSLLQL